MSRVAELIDLIVQGKNAEASDVLNSELLNRSYQAINDIKPDVASNYFAPVVDMTDNELAKLHIRHMVGGRSPEAGSELVFCFEFPERPDRKSTRLKSSH